LEPEEHIVAFGGTPDARYVIATNRGLWLPADASDTDEATAAGEAATATYTRLGWHEVNKATWTGATLTIIPARQVGVIDDITLTVDNTPRSYRLTDAGDLPHEVRVRVTRSVAYRSQHQPTGAGSVWIVARRVPGVNGLSWMARLDADLDPDDPALRDAIHQLVTEARATV